MRRVSIARLQFRADPTARTPTTSGCFRGCPAPRTDDETNLFVTIPGPTTDGGLEDISSKQSDSPPYIQRWDGSTLRSSDRWCRACERRHHRISASSFTPDQLET